MKGPPRRYPGNPCCFTDGSGRAIYLTGSHTWNDVQDMGEAGPSSTFDFGRQGAECCRGKVTGGTVVAASGDGVPPHHRVTAGAGSALAWRARHAEN